MEGSGVSRRCRVGRWVLLQSSHRATVSGSVLTGGHRVVPTSAHDALQLAGRWLIMDLWSTADHGPTGCRFGSMTEEWFWFGMIPDGAHLDLSSIRSGLQDGPSSQFSSPNHVHLPEQASMPAPHRIITTEDDTSSNYYSSLLRTLVYYCSCRLRTVWALEASVQDGRTWPHGDVTCQKWKDGRGAVKFGSTSIREKSRFGESGGVGDALR
nr:hypothetical protein CFP56_09910 [Quercus suber]